MPARWRSLLAFPMLVLPLAAHAQSADTSAARTLAQVELDFARASRERGTRQAFVEYLADSSTIFRDRTPVRGRAWYAAQEDSDDLLTWRPAFVFVSAAGDLGVSTGPWEAHATRDDPAVAARGTYLTIWRTQPDGRWRAELDYGIRRPSAAPSAADSLSLTLDAAPRRFRAPPLESVLEMDRGLAVESRRRGAAAVLADAADTATWTLRWLQEPRRGRHPRTLIFPAERGALEWQPLGGAIASSGDLAYTFGTYTWRAGAERPEQGNYVRVFRRDADGRWRILVDVHRPYPPRQPPA